MKQHSTFMQDTSYANIIGWILFWLLCIYILFVRGPITEPWSDHLCMAVSVGCYFIARHWAFYALRRLGFETDKLNKQEEKIAQTMWYCSNHGATLIVGIFLVLPMDNIGEKSYVWYTDEMWRDWPNHVFSPTAQMYYITAVGFYGSSLFVGDEKIDYKIHHIFTLVLLVLSYMYKFHRIGIVILILHDIADVFLELGKLFHHMGKKYEIYKMITFVIFAVVFYISRLVYYPFWIIYSVIFNARTLFKQNHEEPIGRLWEVMLIGLLLLHCWWGYKIAQKIRQAIDEGTIDTKGTNYHVQ